MISGFVRSGLVAGDRVWCFPNGCQSEVLGWLHRDDVADDDVVASGQLIVQPTHESALSALAFDPDGVIDALSRAVDEALDEGWNGFRLIGDLGWATRGRSCPERLLDFEAQLGEVLCGSPAAVLCQYDRYRYDPATMMALARVHAAVVGAVAVEHELTISPLPGAAGVRLTGEIDLASREQLSVALESALASAGDLHLDLSGLVFIDIGGVQVILAAAERLGRGRRMVVHRPPRSLHLALSLLWECPNLIEVPPVAH